MIWVVYLNNNYQGTIVMKYLVFLFFMLSLLCSCVNHPKSFTINVSMEGKKASLEHMLFSREYGAIRMGSQYGNERRSFKFNFYISNLEDYQYAYLSIDTVGIRRSENSIYLNNRNMGYFRE